MTMKKRYVLIGVAALLGAAGFAWCRAQTPPQHLPVPLVVAPRPMAAKSAPEVATNAVRPAFVWCPACRGRKTVGVEAEGPCRSCAGTGKTKSGFSKTEADCNFCKGTGKVFGLVQQPCPACQAKGVLSAALVEEFIACTNCSGAKMLEEEVAMKCVTCGGAGKIVKSTMGGSFGGKGGKGGSTQEQPCPFCGATGTAVKKVTRACPSCFGAGVIPPPPPPPPPKDG